MTGPQSNDRTTARIPTAAARSKDATTAMSATAGPQPKDPTSAMSATASARPPSGHTQATALTAAGPNEWGDLTWLRTAAEGLRDAIKARVSTENRVKRGATADAIRGGEMIAAARNLEETYGQWIREEYETVVPLRVRQWAAGIPGIASGELFPTLIGFVGNPRVAIPWRWEGKKLVPAGDPYARSLRQFWQWCGCGDPERVPPKNASREELLACGKRTQVRPLLHTFSTSLVMMATPVKKEDSKFYGQPRSQAAADSQFWAIFTAAKADGATHVHERQCQNRKRPPMRSNGCGTVAEPELGAPGSPWRQGHIEMHAHRIVHKEFLRELWRISSDPATEEGTA